MKYAILIFLFSFSSASTALAQQKRFNIDLYYLPYFESTRAITDFGQSVLDLEGSLHDGIGDVTGLSSNFLFRAIYGISWLYLPGFQYYLNNSLKLMMHEYGHGARIAAAGGVPYYSYFGGSGTHFHFLTYYLQGFVSGWNGGYTTSSGTTFSPSIYPSYWNGVVAMGGVNNSTTFAESMSDHNYYIGGHYSHAFVYINSKLDAYYYALDTYQNTLGFPSGVVGDMANIENYYSGQGIGVSLNDIWTGAMNSVLFSAGTYSYALGTLKYIFGKDPVVRALELGPIRLPEVSHYLTSQGLSYRVGSGIHSDQTYIPFSVEMVYKGRTVYEAALAVRKYKDNNPKNPRGYYELGFVANTLGGIGGHYKKEIDAGPNTLIELGAILHHYQTLLGERTTTGINFGPFGFELIASLAKTY